MQKYRILVIDDDVDMLNAYRGMLNPMTPATSGLLSFIGEDKDCSKDNPYDLALYQNGEDGVEALRQSLEDGNAFALALVDMNMAPGIDGLETSKRLRELDKRVLIAIVTANSASVLENIRDEIPEGTRLMHKPFTFEEIFEAVQSCCQEYENANHEYN